MHRSFLGSRQVLRLALLATVVLSLAVPATAGAFEKAMWGSTTPSGADPFPTYKRLGVKLLELDLDWATVAPTQPKNPTNPADPAYQWPADLAATIAEAQANHMQVLLQINTAPSWANGGHTNIQYAPTNPQQFAAFATAAAREYRYVRYWMIWGEPTRAGRFLPEAKAFPNQKLSGRQLSAPHLYARLLDADYGALKAVNRSNIVIGGDTYTTGNIDALQWIQNLKLPNGKPPRMDMYGHNPFTYQAPTFSGPFSAFGEVQFSDLHELAGWIDTYLRKGMPMFLSEFTIPTQADQEFNFYVDPTTAAQWLTTILKLARGYHRIFGLGWVHLYDSPPYSYGGLLTADGQPKPDYYAFQRG